MQIILANLASLNTDFSTLSLGLCILDYLIYNLSTVYENNLAIRQVFHPLDDMDGHTAPFTVAMVC